MRTTPQATQDTNDCAPMSAYQLRTNGLLRIITSVLKGIASFLSSQRIIVILLVYSLVMIGSTRSRSLMAVGLEQADKTHASIAKEGIEAVQVLISTLKANGSSLEELHGAQSELENRLHFWSVRGDD